MNEMNMMKEIRARGPITVGILTPALLSLYKSGVMNCANRLLPKSDLTESQQEILRRIRDGFRPVEHLVTINGWGTSEKGEKYWIVQNTYLPSNLPLAGESSMATTAASYSDVAPTNAPSKTMSIPCSRK